MKYSTITYIGKSSGYVVKLRNTVYEFEWNKGLGIGNRQGEVNAKDIEKIAKWRDKKGRKIFRLDK
jgi:hypothetical protein